MARIPTLQPWCIIKPNHVAKPDFKGSTLNGELLTITRPSAQITTAVKVEDLFCKYYVYKFIQLTSLFLHQMSPRRPMHSRSFIR